MPAELARPMQDFQASLTFLVVEDDDGHAELIIDHLRDARIGKAVQRFHHGGELMAFLARPRPPPREREGGVPDAYVVLLDIQMPQMNGIEVLTELRRDPNLRTLPIFMLTTTDDAHEVGQCYRLGCNGYIVKPVEYAVFAEHLQSLIQFLRILQLPASPRTPAANMGGHPPDAG